MWLSYTKICWRLYDIGSYKKCTNEWMMITGSCRCRVRWRRDRGPRLHPSWAFPAWKWRPSRTPERPWRSSRARTVKWSRRERRKLLTREESRAWRCPRCANEASASLRAEKLVRFGEQKNNVFLVRTKQLIQIPQTFVILPMLDVTKIIVM